MKFTIKKQVTASCLAFLLVAESLCGCSNEPSDNPNASTASYLKVKTEGTVPGLANILNSLAKISDGIKTLDKILPEQIAAMPAEEQAKIESNTYWFMTPEQVQAVNGKNLTASILNELAHDNVDSTKVTKFSPAQIAAMPASEKKKLDTVVVAKFSDEQKRSLIISQDRKKAPSAQLNVK